MPNLLTIKTNESHQFLQNSELKNCPQTSQNFSKLLLKSVNYNCHPSFDRYERFRDKYGPIYLPYASSDASNFFDEFVGQMLDNDVFDSLDTFDVADGEVMTFDLLELLNNINHALLMYENNRICGATHEELLKGPQEL